MGPDEIEALAKQDGIGTKSGLEQKLIVLQSMGWSILQCIVYVRFSQACTLNEAKAIVINSPAWINKKEGFIKHQQEIQQEFLEHAMEKAKAIEMIITPEGTSYKIIT